jgi:branched-chain amino acid transport system permease protein
VSSGAPREALDDATGAWRGTPRPWLADLILLAIAMLVPIVDVASGGLGLIAPAKSIFIFAIVALGLNIVTGFTGLLHLGIAAFMAIGVYAFAILTNESYPFRLSFWPALFLTLPIGAIAGFVLGSPTLGLRGDYLAIVTLGFGEIVQDVLRNVETVTQGTQGINPVAKPFVPWLVTADDGTRTFAWTRISAAGDLAWYILLLLILIGVVVFVRNLERSRVGRAWMSVREDELASKAMGIPPVRTKMSAFATGAALAAFAGGLWASTLDSTGEPANYDFQVSILALCIVIVGGMGSVTGVLVGAVVMVGANDIVLDRLTQFIQKQNLVSDANVLGSPNNWKYMLFGLALVFMMRFKPDGLVSRRGSGGRSGGRR